MCMTCYLAVKWCHSTWEHAKLDGRGYDVQVHRRQLGSNIRLEFV